MDKVVLKSNVPFAGNNSVAVDVPGEVNDSLAKSANVVSVETFMKDLDRIQDQQVVYTNKVLKEKKRSEALDESIRIAREELLRLQSRTKNGKIVREDDSSHRKKLHKLEHQVQMAKIKLCGWKGDNMALRKGIEELRRNKLMYMQILKDIENELTSTKKKTAESHREVITLNEKRHRAKLEISNIKNKMLAEIEDFAGELDRAKHNISDTQTNLLQSIRERLSENSMVAHSAISPTRAKLSHTEVVAPHENEHVRAQHEISTMLEEIGMKNLSELVNGLHLSEEQMFGLYKKIQGKNAEMEQLDLENKELEAELAVQSKQVTKLEFHNNQVRKDLEAHISTIQQSITKYEGDYNSHLEVLSSIAESLMNLLRNIAIDEEALDQQLITAGISDRNVDAFLGLIEQRIDDLIQMSKAAAREALKNDDFVQLSAFRSGQIALQTPVVPSLSMETTGMEDEEDIDESAKLQPISISLLKEYMQKRIQKGLQKKPTPHVVPHPTHPVPGSHHASGQPSGQTSGQSSPKKADTAPASS